MVKLATFKTKPETLRSQLSSRVLSSSSWAQFGDEVVLFAMEKDWSGIVESAERSGLNLREFSAPVERDRLYVVVQNGRLFQQEHPDVPVILDQGRFILVNVDLSGVARLQDQNGTCYGLQPLEDNQVIFDIPEPSVARADRVNWVQGIVDKLNREGFEADLAHLVSFPTRFSTSHHFAEAAAWAREHLESMGYTVRSPHITIDNRENETSQNIIADKAGTGSDPRKVVLVVAHLDSINIEEGPASVAPGADDNASGSAGLLQMASAFRDHQSLHDIRFVLFGGEEEGLFGSKQYVDSLSASEQSRILAVINMDMIATLNSEPASVLLEGAPVSQSVIDALADSAAMYTNLKVQTSLHPFASDHVPFIRANIPAVLTIEGADNANTNIHSRRDTLDHINSALALEILRMNVAYVATKVGIVGTREQL